MNALEERLILACYSNPKLKKACLPMLKKLSSERTSTIRVSSSKYITPKMEKSLYFLSATPTDRVAAKRVVLEAEKASITPQELLKVLSDYFVNRTGINTVLGVLKQEGYTTPEPRSYKAPGVPKQKSYTTPEPRSYKAPGVTTEIKINTGGISPTLKKIMIKWSKEQAYFRHLSRREIYEDPQNRQLAKLVFLKAQEEGIPFFYMTQVMDKYRILPISQHIYSDFRSKRILSRKASWVQPPATRF